MNIYLIRRYFIFIISLFINAIGVAFITKALLGTSPITSINYVLSMFTPLSMGQWTIISNIIFVLLELFFITRKELLSDLRGFLLQIPISLCFGLFIDLAMGMLYGVIPSSYVEKLLTLLLGCVVLAAGIALEVKANVAMTSGEYFVRVISLRFKKEFGYVKLGFDITLVLLACLLSLLFMSDIQGVREGTVIAALAVGPIVHFLSPYYRFLDSWIKTGKYAPNALSENTGNTIITIAREFGSGGRLLGKMLARELGIKLYDKEFICAAALERGMDKNYILREEKSIPSFWLKCILSQNSGCSLERSLSTNDVRFVAESKVIQDLAGRGNCIIVGRCADFVLKDYPHVIRVFCYSDQQSARTRCTNEYGIPEKDVENEIKRVNRNRIAHYEYYSGEKWGEPHHYDLMVNTGCLDLQVACEMIKGVYQRVRHQVT